MGFVPKQEIRAHYRGQTIRVYQAYNRQIALSAIKAGTFVSPPFSTRRISWLGPSFSWVLYRTGWARRDPDQAHILAIDILREGFEWSLQPGQSNGAKQSQNDHHGVHITWQPERDLRFRRLPYQTIRLGLEGEALARYLDHWIVDIADVTEKVHEIEAHVKRGDIERAAELMPEERPYVYLDDAMDDTIERTA